MRSRVFIPAVLLLTVFQSAFAQIQLIQDGGFESQNIAPWQLAGSGIGIVSGVNANGGYAYAGAQYLSMGNFSGATQYAYQTITFPTNLIGATLSLYYQTVSGDPNGDDYLYFYIRDTNNSPLIFLAYADSAHPTGGYVNYTTNFIPYAGAGALSPYAGQTVELYFYVTTDLTEGSLTSFDIDNVSLLAATTANIPSNDNFTNATPILGSPFTSDVNTTYASKEPGEPYHAGNAGGHSVWWTWTAPAVGSVNINTTGSGFDTLLAVYTNASSASPAFKTLACVSSNNGATRGTGLAALAFTVPTQAQVGTQYYIALDGYNGRSGNAVLNFTFTQDATPSVAFSSPAAGAAVTNSSVLVQGTASDIVAVASVQCQLSNASGTNLWQPAFTTNAWTNWSVTVTNLIPGPNTVTIEAFNTSGASSILVPRVFDYRVPAPLALSIQGRGVISGATNGLDVGFPYTLTAKVVPGSGFAFTGWTGSIVTNTASLSFLMATNLSFTANFADVQKPTLTITTPTSGERWSNSLFQIAGKAADNVAVAAVYYQFDSTNWTLVTNTANGFTNWTANVTLTPGPNTISAYAEDTSTNFSTPTNRVTFFYVVTAPLLVETNLAGTILPDHNTNFLAIESNYTITAAAYAGLAFTNWTGGTNPPFSVLTNKPRLTFTMVSNLTLIANFVDTNPPSLGITSPTTGQRWSNSTFAATGTAKDNVQVSNVLWQLNGTGWHPAQPLNGWSNWTAQLTNLESTNIFQAYSQDTSGNKSPTNKVSFLYIPSAMLTVEAGSGGSVTPAYNNKWLAIGTNYTLTAVASNHWLFSNWVGGTTLPYTVLSASNSYTFTMQSNLVLRANFVTNFFNAAQGNYYGLFAPADSPRQQTNSGSFTLTVTSAGAVSGDLYLGAEKIPFSGVKFNVSGMAQFSATPSGGRPLTNTLQLNLADQSVQGTVTDGSFVAILNGDQAVFTSTKQATNYEGQYTLIIPGTNNPEIGPFGTSFGTVTVSSTGAIRFVGGNLADGTTGLSQSSGVSKDGYWPFYVPLYNGAGSLWGTNYFTNHTLISAPCLSWINATNSAEAALYRSGFTNEQAVVIGALYASTNKPLLDLTNAEVTLEGGNLPFSVTNQIEWASNNTINAPTSIAGNTNGLKLTVTTPGSGLITGSILNPTNKTKTIAINGVLLQNQTNAQGYFLGTNASGTFLLVPR
jgi:hypothetical protein